MSAPGISGEMLRACPGGVTLEVLASAGASRSCVRGVHGNAVKVAVRAAPEKGKANAEIEEVLAEFFGVSRKQAAVIAGGTSRSKRVQINGVTLGAARTKLEHLSR